MVSVILLAWGNGTRFGSDKCKALLAGKPVFLHSLQTFHDHNQIKEIIIVAKQEETKDYKTLKTNFPKIKKVVEGWSKRQFSVRNGIQKATQDITLIHNWANPLVSSKEISQTIQATKKYGAAVVGYPAINTLKKVDKNGLVIQTVPRKDIYEVQTPQGVITTKFKKLLTNNSSLVTDDVSFFEHANLPVKIIPCSPNNFKITHPADLTKAESLLNPQIKIWIGHDSHRIDQSKKFITLGWIQINCRFGLEGNSDADVLTHSICNAIGTAIGQGSLSKYSDPMCHQEDITDSSEYLKHIFSEAQKLGYEIGNLACTIEAKKPKLEKHIPTMKKILSQILNCTTLQIGIACTSGEELSTFGKGLGIQCFAHILLTKKKFLANFVPT